MGVRLLTAVVIHILAITSDPLCLLTEGQRMVIPRGQSGGTVKLDIWPPSNTVSRTRGVLPPCSLLYNTSYLILSCNKWISKTEFESSACVLRPCSFWRLSLHSDWCMGLQYFRTNCFVLIYSVCWRLVWVWFAPFSFLLWLAANGKIFLYHFFYCLLSRSGFLLSCLLYLDSLSTCVWEPQQYTTAVAAMTSFADHGASLHFSFFLLFGMLYFCQLPH